MNRMIPYVGFVVFWAIPSFQNYPGAIWANIGNISAAIFVGSVVSAINYRFAVNKFHPIVAWMLSVFWLYFAFLLLRLFLKPIGYLFFGSPKEGASGYEAARGRPCRFCGNRVATGWLLRTNSEACTNAGRRCLPVD